MTGFCPSLSLFPSVFFFGCYSCAQITKKTIKGILFLHVFGLRFECCLGHRSGFRDQLCQHLGKSAAPPPLLAPSAFCPQPYRPVSCFFGQPLLLPFIRVCLLLPHRSLLPACSNISLFSPQLLLEDTKVQACMHTLQMIFFALPFLPRSLHLWTALLISILREEPG